MGRSVVLSNGSMFVGLNEHGLVHDFYYPYVGLDNLTTARSVHHMIGVWVDGAFSWLDDGNWQTDVQFESDALVSNIVARNDGLNIELRLSDFVDVQHNSFCRIIKLKNNADLSRDVRIFFHQVFQISNDGRADTALYVPSGNYLFDYKGHCSLLIFARSKKGQELDQFAVGNYGIEGKQGTYLDAEDGELSNNLVEHGGVDSVARCRVQLEAHAEEEFEYWIIADNSQSDAEEVHTKLKTEGLTRRLEYVRGWWRQWLGIGLQSIGTLPEEYEEQFKKSLLVVKAHIDKHGGIIASGDSSIYNYGRDYYSYVWPRDAALTLLPLIELGYSDEAKRFFAFCVDTIHPKGYMMHKYQSDRSIGSTWHPLMHQNHPELAIQEDETASVIFAIYKYYEKFKDHKLIEKLFPLLIKPASDFMARFIDEDTSLPHASYDLWEERFATHTYTAAVVMAALKGAASLAEVLDRHDDAASWSAAAERIADGMKLLFDPEQQAFRKSLLLQPDGNLLFDNRLDSSSSYGIMLYGDERWSVALAQSFAETERKLSTNPAGGVARYEKDYYFLHKQQYLGNSWIICTLWFAKYYLQKGETAKARELIDWVMDKKTASSMFSEQTDPETGAPVSVTPLVWSHAEFVETIIALTNPKN